MKVVLLPGGSPLQMEGVMIRHPKHWTWTDDNKMVAIFWVCCTAFGAAIGAVAGRWWGAWG